MEFSDPQFWLAVLQIIAIDVLLGGDNAVVIALACRRLPEKQRTQGIVWGVAGAIALRIALLFFAVQLLELPYLKLIGGALLLWIGIKLLLPEEGEGHGEVAASTGLLGAIKTIIVADAVMSLDNVVAVAGAADGEFILVVFGIAVSVPIIVWGSRFVLKLMDRFPVVITLGAALLGWIAGKMAASDVVVEPWIGPHWTHYAAAVVGAIFVVLAGKALARRAEKKRIEPTSAPVQAPATRILLPVDGSEAALLAVDHIVHNFSSYRQPVEVHLINVQHTVPGEVSQFVGGDEVRKYHTEEGLKVLARARAKLDQARVVYRHHVAVGETAPQIADYARDNGIDKIVMGGKARGAVAERLFDSIPGQVMRLSTTPVLLVK